MQNSTLIALLSNASLLLALAIVYDFIIQSDEKRNVLKRALAGVILGSIAVGLMLAAFEPVPGLVFDIRSVLFSLSGLFFGALPTGVAVVIAAVFRVIQGGIGVGPGIFAMVLTGSIGLVWRRFRHCELEQLSAKELYLFGLASYLLIIVATLTLPWSIAMTALSGTAVPILLVFPVVTVALGKMLSKRFRRQQLAVELEESEQTYRSLFLSDHIVMLLIDPETGDICDANPGASRFYGWSCDELRSMNVSQINSLSPSEIQARLNEARNQKRHDFLFQHQLADGSLRDVEVVSGPITINHQHLLYSIIHDVTERKRARDELQKNQKFMSDVLDAMPDMIWMKDPDGVFLMCNTEFENLVGVAQEKLVGSTDYDFFPKGLADACLEQDADVIKNGNLCIHEEPLWHVTRGVEIWYETIKTPVYDRDGKILGVLGVGRNIAERRSAAEEVENSKELLSNMVDAIPDMLWMKDPAGKYLLCNRQFEKLVKKSKSQIIGLTDYDLFPKEKADFYEKRDRIAIENKKTTANEESAEYTADGYSIWVETLKTPLFGKRDELIGVLGIGRDISRRKQALKESEEKQMFLDMVVDLSPVPMWIGSPTGTVLRGNDAFYKTLNLTPEQIVGKYNLLNDDNLRSSEMADNIEALFSRKERVHFEMMWKAAAVQAVDFSGGRDLVLDVSIYPLLNAEGEITHIICQWMDVSERKKAEETLINYRRDLENEVHDRTKELRTLVNAMAGRENRMADLKRVVRALRTQIEQAGMIPVDTGDQTSEQSGAESSDDDLGSGEEENA